MTAGKVRGGGKEVRIEDGGRRGQENEKVEGDSVDVKSMIA